MTPIRPVPPLPVCLLVCSLALSPPAVGQPDSSTDWPQWLGPYRNGSSGARGVFPEDQVVKLEVAWRRPVGPGLAAVTVRNGSLFTMEEGDDTDYVLALNSEDGSGLWRQPVGPHHPGAADGPASTPAADGLRVYALSSRCRLVALDASSGVELWSHDLVSEMGAERRRTGCATSPLLDAERVVVQVSGRSPDRLVAFDGESGKVAWASPGEDRSLYTSPIAAFVGGDEQIIVHRLRLESRPVSGLYGVAARSGEVLWSAWQEEGFSFATPVLLPDDRILLPQWNQVSVFRLVPQEGGYSLEQEWSSGALAASPGSPVHYRRHLYGFQGDHLVCISADDGSVRWRRRVFPGSLILVDGHLVILSQFAGVLRVVPANPTSSADRIKLDIFSPRARNDTPPSFAEGKVFVRNLDELAVVKVTVP